MFAKSDVRIDPFFLQRTAAKSVRRALESGGDIRVVSRLVGIGAMTAAEEGAFPVEDALREAGAAVLREAARAGADIGRAARGLVEGLREGARRAGRDPAPLLAALDPGTLQSRYPSAHPAAKTSRSVRSLRTAIPGVYGWEPAAASVKGS